MYLLEAHTHTHTHTHAHTHTHTGLNASVGAYVAFLDDDDAWLPEKLVLQVL